MNPEAGVLPGQPLGAVQQPQRSRSSPRPAPRHPGDVALHFPTHFYDALKAFEVASGQPVPCQFALRRVADVAQCYADASLAKRLLGWQATRLLADMCADAWRWQQGNPQGHV